jgi:hypothetical protein
MWRLIFVLLVSFASATPFDLDFKYDRMSGIIISADDSIHKNQNLGNFQIRTTSGSYPNIISIQLSRVTQDGANLKVDLNTTEYATLTSWFNANGETVWVNIPSNKIRDSNSNSNRAYFDSNKNWLQHTNPSGSDYLYVDWEDSSPIQYDWDTDSLTIKFSDDIDSVNLDGEITLKVIGTDGNISHSNGIKLNDLDSSQIMYSGKELAIYIPNKAPSLEIALGFQGVSTKILFEDDLVQDGDGRFNLAVKNHRNAEFAQINPPANSPFSAVSPATSAFINNTDISYTLSSDISEGSVIFTKVNEPNNSDTINLHSDQLLAGAKTLANSISLEEGSVYKVKFTATNGSSNFLTVLSNSVTFDTSSPIISGVYPTAVSDTITNANVAYHLNEDLASGKVTFTEELGFLGSFVSWYNGSSPDTAIAVLTGDELKTGSFSGALTNAPTLNNAYYKITFDGLDFAGNSVTDEFTDDGTTFITTGSVLHYFNGPVFSNLSPVSSTFVNNAPLYPISCTHSLPFLTHFHTALHPTLTCT